VATARSGELRALARRIVDGLPLVVADVVLTGSVSRGVADELSDVELLVVPRELPSLGQCTAILRDAGLDAVESWTPPAPVYWTAGRRDGEFVELIWWPSSYVDERVRAIAAAEIVDHRRLRTAEALVNGEALRGTAHAGWRSRLLTYPDLLAPRIVADAAETWHEHPRSELTLMRDGDTLVLAQRLVEDAENVLRIVFAVNRAWQPGWKRAARAAEALPSRPERLAERIDGALRSLDLRAMRELVLDALALAPGVPAVVRARIEVEAFLS
jgi:predicted nucleotidyltransferase